MYFKCSIKFNYILYIELPSTKFIGSCRDKDDNYDYSDGDRTSGVTVLQCYDLCRSKHYCVAFRYDDRKSSCDLMVNGPYTHGSGSGGFTCYIMPTSKI